MSDDNILPFITRLDNIALDLEVIEYDRVEYLRQIADIEIRLLDLQRRIDGLIADMHEAASKVGQQR
jgi:hypothetical protein